MRKMLTILLLVIFASFGFATDVTFIVNMATFPDGATDSTSTVHIRGSMNGWGDSNQNDKHGWRLLVNNTHINRR